MSPFIAPPSPRNEWAYFLDVDGTLLDIAETPSDVFVDVALLDLIARLYRASSGALALVSGRSLSDLDSLVGSARIPMAGQHGLERRDGAGRLWIHATPPKAKCAIKEALTPIVERHTGLILEDKGLTLALHYRKVPHLGTYVLRLLSRLSKITDTPFELQRGKCVVELKPAGVDKGTAIAEYLSEDPFRGRTPVFIGDDLNDEHGFSEVNKLDGISVKVGTGPSCARYRLPDVADVRHWLASALRGQE
ncbi:MAG: trehalose-phosphatase [Rhodocyclaceae bacterium]|nr:trehalose-phosphatase [Rhodocyclaceae bacterium]